MAPDALRVADRLAGAAVVAEAEVSGAMVVADEPPVVAGAVVLLELELLHEAAVRPRATKPATMAARFCVFTLCFSLIVGGNNRQ